MNITLPRAVIEQALEALEWEFGLNPVGKKTHETITALRTALEQPQPVQVSPLDFTHAVLARRMRLDVLSFGLSGRTGRRHECHHVPCLHRFV